MTYGSDKSGDVDIPATAELELGATSYGPETYVYWLLYQLPPTSDHNVT